MKHLLSHLHHHLPHDLGLLEQMVNMDSPSLDKALIDRFVHFVGKQFEDIGGAVDYIPAEKSGDHLRVFFPGGTMRPILLLGHTDTVFSAGEAARRPFAVRDGRAAGPGVFDMKAGILLMLSALRALLAVDGGLRRPVVVLLTSDEEVGSPSSRTIIESEGKRAEAVLVLEPSLPGGVLKTARKGVGTFTIQALGRAAHAGVDPLKGINAIEEIAHQVLALRRLAEATPEATVTAGVIRGGTRTNVVPAEAMVEVDVRVATLEQAEQITQGIRSLRPHLPGSRLEIRGGVNRPPMERTSATERLFTLAQSIAREMALPLQEGSTGGASDGNFTAAMGIPTLDGLGAVGDGAHSLDEFVEIESLPSRAALVAGLIQRV